jgi:ribosomal protein L24
MVSNTKQVKSPQGGIVKKEASLQISNISLIDLKQRATRVGIRVEGDKSKIFKNLIKYYSNVYT